AGPAGGPRAGRWACKMGARPLAEGGIPVHAGVAGHSLPADGTFATIFPLSGTAARKTMVALHASVVIGGEKREGGVVRIFVVWGGALPNSPPPAPPAPPRGSASNAPSPLSRLFFF